MESGGGGFMPRLAVSAATVEAVRRDEHSQSEWPGRQATLAAFNPNIPAYSTLGFTNAHRQPTGISQTSVLSIHPSLFLRLTPQHLTGS
jgi:hypothetical protein